MMHMYENDKEVFSAVVSAIGGSKAIQLIQETRRDYDALMAALQTLEASAL